MQINNQNRNLGFASLKIDPIIWEKGSKELKKGLVEALPDISKHSKNADILITFNNGIFGILSEKTKNIQGLLITGKGSSPFDKNKVNKEDIIATLKNSLFYCRRNLRENYNMNFCTKNERALKDPEAYLAKLAKQQAHAEKLKNRPIEYSI